MNSEKKLTLLLAAALALITLVLFWRVTGFDFTNYDDQDYVSNNPHVQRGLNLSEIGWAIRTGHASNWHPLTWISHMLDWQIYGNKAGGHHLTNLLLHTAASVLLFLVLKQITAAIWRSAIVAALFAWHPIHVESVAWIAERKDVLSAFFWMLTIWAYARYAEGFKVRSSRFKVFYALALLAFALGLMSKPMLVTMPFVLLLVDFWPLKRMQISDFKTQKFGKLLLEKIPFFALAVASSVVTFFVQRHAGTVRTLTSIPFEYRLVNVFLSYFRYLGKMFWPSQLAVFYPLPDYLSLWLGLVASLGLVAVSAWIICLMRRRPYLVVGWLWYLGTLVPVVGLVQVGAQSMADRYSYIPLIGVFIAVVWLLADVTAKLPQQRIICATLATGILTACVVRTSLHLPNWKNSIALFEHALAATGNNFVANVNLGSALLAQNRLDDALFQYRESLKSDETFEAFGSIATILEKKGQLDEAAENFRKAIEMQPTDKLMRNNYGAVLIRLGKFDEAAEQFSAALKSDPQYAQALSNLGVVLEKKNQLPEAVEQFRAALKLDAKNIDLHTRLGTALQRMGRLDDAIAEFSVALQIKPDFAEVHYGLATALADQKKTDEAIAQYLTAIQLKPDYADARNNLSVLLAEKGRWSEAVEQMTQVVQARPDDAQAHFNLSYVLSKLGKRDESKAHYDLALKLDPELLKSRTSKR